MNILNLRKAMQPIFFLFAMVFVFSLRAIGQIDEGRIATFRLVNLLEKVQSKSARHRASYLSEYDRTYRLTIEREGKSKVDSRVFEQYCLNDGKPFCSVVEVESNGKVRTSSQIRKDREKAAKNLTKNQDYVQKNDIFGYGATLNSLWIEPSLYLKSCQIISAVERMISERTAILLHLDNCKLSDVYSKWNIYLYYMPKTTAEVLIDEKDESIMRMDVFPRKEFFTATGLGKPIITVENTRMTEGLWLFKKIRMESIGNKLIFPDLKDNYQIDFYGYKRYEVEVMEKTNSLTKK